MLLGAILDYTIRFLFRILVSTTLPSGWPCSWSRIRLCRAGNGASLDGFYTLSDQTMYDMLSWLGRKKAFVLNLRHWRVWPGLSRVRISKLPTDARFQRRTTAYATHLVWATGGGMVPEEEMEHIWQKAVHNVSTQHRHPFPGERCCRWRRLKIPGLTRYNPFFYHHPTPFAVNGGFANQTKT